MYMYHDVAYLSELSIATMASASSEVELQDFGTIFSLEGRVAVVTGGSRGLGLNVASGSVSTFMLPASVLTKRFRLLQAGCSKVFIISRKADACESAVAALNRLTNKAPSSKAISLPADLSKVAEIDRIVEEIGKETNHVDLLFANAGATWGAPFEEQPESAFSKILDLNIKSIFYTVQKMQGLLRARGRIGDPSSVIINSSAAGIGVGTLGKHGTHAYSVSKAGAVHLAKILAVELGPRGINTNAICPGFYPTKMSAGLIDLQGGLEEQAVRSPNLRLGKPEDIAGLVVFLGSRAGSHINGAVITTDGGTHLGSGKL